MRYRYATFIKAINLGADYVLLNVSMIAACLLTDKQAGLFEHNQNYLPVVLMFNLIWLLASNITGFYEAVFNRDSIYIYRNTIRTYIFFVTLICVTLILLSGSKGYLLSKNFLLYTLALWGFLLGLWKLIFLGIRKSDRALLADTRRAVIVGGGMIGRDVYNYLSNNPDAGYQPSGFFEDDPDKIFNSSHYLGAISACMKYVIDNKINEIFCTLSNSESAKIQYLMQEADKNLIRFKLVPEYYLFEKRPTIIEGFGHIPVISFRQEPLENILNRFLKRSFDILFSLFVIVFILSWLMPILAIIIKLESKGPVFFVQLRSGKDNAPFKCYKFRSMRVNKDSDKKQASRQDARITKVGAFIRKTNIDELPQFFNVLIGDMSIVGPRPHMLSHTEEYSKLISKFMVRHFLKPGITGWAQVSGYRGETRTIDAMEQRVEADVWYLENWSFLLDLKIIFLTVWNTFKGEENAF